MKLYYFVPTFTNVRTSTNVWTFIKYYCCFGKVTILHGNFATHFLIAWKSAFFLALAMDPRACNAMGSRDSNVSLGLQWDLGTTMGSEDCSISQSGIWSHRDLTAISSHEIHDLLAWDVYEIMMISICKHILTTAISSYEITPWDCYDITRIFLMQQKTRLTFFNSRTLYEWHG